MFICNCILLGRESNESSMALSAMKRLHCEQFRLRVEFDEKDFKRSVFMREVVEKDRDGSAFSFTYPSKTSDEHAHAHISLDEGVSTLNLNYVANRMLHEEMDEEPYMEDAATYLVKFFKRTRLKGEASLIFEYGKEFKSVLQLDYPILGAGDVFNGSRVIGHDIIFPEESFVNAVSISSLASKGVLLFLFGTIDVDLKRFNLYSQIERFSKFNEQLVRRKEGHARRQVKR